MVHAVGQGSADQCYFRCKSAFVVASLLAFQSASGNLHEPRIFPRYFRSVFHDGSDSDFFVTSIFGDTFLDAPSHLYNRLCPLVGLSVGWSVTHSLKTSKSCIFSTEIKF